MDISEALQNVDMTYRDLMDIVEDAENETLGTLNALIENIRMNAESLTNEEIRNALSRLSLEAYTFSEIKERSAFKANLAETIRKEAYAKSFAEATGTVGQKESAALLNISAQVIAEQINELLSNLFKTKLDETHRVVDTLKTILMSRMTEAKLITNDLQ